MLVEVLRKFYTTSLNKDPNHLIDEIDSLFREIFSKKQIFLKFDSSASKIQSYGLCDNKPLFSHLAIIIQGSVMNRENFVRESCALYQKFFPEAIVILSTWEEEKSSIENFFKDLNVRIIYSKKPINQGYSNINLQITSTLNAIENLVGEGIQVVIKSRTDQRFTNFATIGKMYSDLMAPNHPSKNRIFTTNSNTFLYRLFGVSDMFQVGRFEKMRAYWKAPLDNRSVNELKESTSKANNSWTFSNLMICEVYLAFNYAKTLNPGIEFKYKHWLEFLRDYIFLIDEREIGLVWPKYSFDYNRFPSGQLESAMYQVTVLDWLRMQNSLIYYLQLEPNIFMPFKCEEK